MGPLAKEALKLFYKKFGKKVIKTAADSKWIADKIKELSKITQKVTTKVRKDLKNLGVGTKDRPYPGFIPKIVKPIKVPEQTKNILNIKSTLKGRPVKVVPKTKIAPKTKFDKALEKIGIKDRTFIAKDHVKGPKKWIFDPKTGKTFEEKVVGPAKIIYGRFPKKPPGKAEGGIASFAEGELVLPRRKPEGLLLEEEKRKIDRNRRNIIKNQDAFDDKGAAILELLDEDEMFWRRNMKDWIERNEVLHEDAGIAGAGGLGGLLGERVNFKKGMSVKEKKQRQLYFDLGRDDFKNIFEYLQSEQAEEDYNRSFAEGGRVGLRAGTTTLPYLSRGWSQPGVYKAPRGFTGMEDMLTGSALGIAAAASAFSKDKDKPVSAETEESKLPEQKPPEDPDLLPDIVFTTVGEMYKGKKGLQHGAHYKRLMKQYKSQGMDLFKSSEKAMAEAIEITRNKKLEVVEKYMNEVGHLSDDFVDLIDEHTRLTDYDMYKDIKRWDSTRPDLADKMRALRFPDWAEARYGADYEGVFQRQQARALRESIDPNIKEPAHPSFVGEQQMVDEIDEMNKANIDEIIKGRKKNAYGGRIGFQDGEGVMSRTGNVVDVGNIPYYAGKGLQGLVHSAETLSKLPFAAGELGSELLQRKPSKEMFSEAIENITPGSWSENLGLTSLIEGMEKDRSPEAITAGGILGLGTEIAVPTGGAFKAGQFLLNKANKAMGKIKDGKNLNKLIDEKLTDFGQSRRDFNIMAGTSGLMIALKSIGLGGLFKGGAKKVDDIRVTYKTGVNEPYEWDDVATWAGNYEFESLTAKGINILRKVFGKDGVRTVKDPSGKLTGYVDNVDIGEATSWVDDVKKAGGKMELEHVDDYGNTGKVYESINRKGIKLTDKQEFLNASGIDSGYGLYDDSIDEVYDIIHGIGPEDPELLSKFLPDLKLKGPRYKSEGGRIGLEGGGPAYEDFEEFMEEMKGMNKQQSREEFLKSWEKYKKWKYGDELSGGYLRREEVAGGGRLTRTIPPKRGPVPQGLSYLLYDDTMRTGSI